MLTSNKIFTFSASHSSGREIGDLDVAVDVESVVFGRQHDRAVLHESHVKALGMLHLGDIVVS